MHDEASCTKPEEGKATHGRGQTAAVSRSIVLRERPLAACGRSSRNPWSDHENCLEAGVTHGLRLLGARTGGGLACSVINADLSPSVFPRRRRATEAASGAGHAGSHAGSVRPQGVHRAAHTDDPLPARPAAADTGRGRRLCTQRSAGGPAPAANDTTSLKRCTTECGALPRWRTGGTTTRRPCSSRR